ncbi:hypothetical protein FIA58_013820 [Flavobacterium jejuense]|uniref:Uncharacterized protein n=1 Tax=Flavobacterium jejuense TaxID=1544455 RepID=A0ABX0IW77_9FLAO|nr:hypothetical protein [Flavobacterium jejuense]NHN26758.1 hypothetical protein [Flavobacterium jejuense]
MELSFGQKAVGIVVTQGLESAQIDEVTTVKMQFAKIIDLINSKPSESYLANTLKGMAIRACITASAATVRILVNKD